MTITAIEERINRIVNPIRFGTHDELENVRALVTESVLADLLPQALEHVIRDGERMSGSATEVASVYSVEVYDELVAYKSLLEGAFSETLADYQTAKKAWAEALHRLQAYQGAKTPNFGMIAQQEQLVNDLHEKLAIPFENFMNARRAEELIRCVPAAYKSQKLDDVLWVLLQIMRVDAYTSGMNIRAQANEMIARIF